MANYQKAVANLILLCCALLILASCTDRNSEELEQRRGQIRELIQLRMTQMLSGASIGIKLALEADVPASRHDRLIMAKMELDQGFNDLELLNKALKNPQMTATKWNKLINDQRRKLYKTAPSFGQ